MNIPSRRLRIAEGVVEIDGSFGEGGGQIVRTACALSTLTGLACRIRQVRAGRSQPGLRPQHCTTLKGLARLCGAETSPLVVGSEEVFFRPGPIGNKDLELDTGTAGSVSLVLQGLLLAGLGAPGPEVRFLLRGGTDVPGAPSCDYLKNVKGEVLKRMGYRIDLRIQNRGYYPRGGGTVEARVRPPEADLLEPLHLLESSEAVAAHGISHASKSLASRQVAERQGRAAARILTECLHIPARIESDYGASPGDGSALILWSNSRESVWGGSSLGRRGMTSEQVAEEAAGRLLRTYHCRAALDPWLGDQILPYLALARGPSVVSVPTVTRHMRTNMWLVQHFLNVRFYAEPLDNRVLVHCQVTEK